jgi:hypothetical protein
MTSDSAPSPYACTVSSWYNQSGGESFPVWKAFDKEGMNPSSANASNRGWCTTSADAQTQSS